MNAEQMKILIHTVSRAAGGFYCGDSIDMKALVKQGLMEYAGRKPCCSDKFFKITEKGRRLAKSLR